MSQTNRQQKSLLDTFESLHRDTRLRLAHIDKPLSLALATLYLAKSEAGITQLTTEHIEACLEQAGVAVKRDSLSKAMSRAGGTVKSERMGPDTYYKIMTIGELQAEDVLSESGLSLVSISDGTPRTSRQELDKFLQNLQGDIIVCDPYIGSQSLDSLQKIDSKANVKMLTKNITGNKSKVNREIRDFLKEFSNFEIRLAHDTTKIHDRYVIDSKAFFLIGHGLKDIGKSSSFILQLDRALVEDIAAQVIVSFKHYWSTATKLK